VSTSENIDPIRLGGSISGPGGPHDRGAFIIDTTGCVLLNGIDVCTVDQVIAGKLAGQAIYMTLQGRVNKTTRQVQVGYLFGPDGAAAMIVELLSLADRHGSLLADLVSRMVQADNAGYGSIAALRDAIDLAEEKIKKMG